MQTKLLEVGEVGVNLAMLVSWEWNAENRFLVVHLVNNVLYLREQQGEEMWRLLLMQARRGRRAGVG